MRSPIEQIRRGLAYLRDHYGPGREPHYYLYVDGGELQQVTTKAVAAAIEDHTRRLRTQTPRRR